jgi:DNA polymerase III gamma/tau subunit
MSDFWNKKATPQPRPWEAPAVQAPAQEVILDEEAMSELQEDPELDIFQEEEDDVVEAMHDADLRLEMGRLWQMILRHDLFGETDANPKAIRSVQRTIRKLAKESMEIMLGIRQEQAIQETIVSSPFNDLEVTVLKMLADKMSKGQTSQSQPQAPAPVPVAPKKDGISSISGQLRPNTNPAPIGKPLSKTGKAVPKAQLKPAEKPVQHKSALKPDESVLSKPIEEMTQEELAAHDAAALERRSRNKSAMPTNMVPHPTPQALEMLYTSQVQQVSSGPLGNLLALTSR